MWIGVKGILAVGFLNPTASVDDTSIDNTRRNAIYRLLSGKRDFFYLIHYRLHNDHDTDTFLLSLNNQPIDIVLTLTPTTNPQ